MNTYNLSDEDIKNLIEQLDSESKIDSSSDLTDLELKELLEEFKEETGEEFQASSEEISGKYQLPIRGGKILSSFVSKETAQSTPGSVASLEMHPEGHEAIDVIVPGFNMKTNSGMGAPVYPIGPGKVTKVTSPQENLKGGFTCTIQHSQDPGLTSYYAHLKEVKVSVGAVVDSNTVIGLNGNTGSAKSTSPHVHLSTTLNGKKLNPLTDVIGKEFGSLSKKASYCNKLYKISSELERLVKLNYRHQ